LKLFFNGNFLPGSLQKPDDLKHNSSNTTNTNESEKLDIFFET